MSPAQREPRTRVRGMGIGDEAPCLASLDWNSSDVSEALAGFRECLRCERKCAEYLGEYAMAGRAGWMEDLDD